MPSSMPCNILGHAYICQRQMAVHSGNEYQDCEARLLRPVKGSHDLLHAARRICANTALLHSQGQRI